MTNPAHRDACDAIGELILASCRLEQVVDDALDRLSAIYDPKAKRPFKLARRIQKLIFLHRIKPGLAHRKEDVESPLKAAIAAVGLRAVIVHGTRRVVERDGVHFVIAHRRGETPREIQVFAIRSLAASIGDMAEILDRALAAEAG